MRRIAERPARHVAGRPASRMRTTLPWNAGRAWRAGASASRLWPRRRAPCAFADAGAGVVAHGTMSGSRPRTGFGARRTWQAPGARSSGGDRYARRDTARSRTCVARDRAPQPVW